MPIERILRLLPELQLLDNDLRNCADGRKHWFLELSDLHSLKTALDTARHTVWACVLGFEQTATPNIGRVLRDYRMARVMFMLHELQATSAEDPTVALFFREVVRMVTSEASGTSYA